MNRAMAQASWRGVGVGSAAMGAALTRRLLARVWHTTKGGDPPANPASRSTTWSEALLYAALSGVVVGVVRLVMARGAAELWERVTGELPPGLEDVS